MARNFWAAVPASGTTADHSVGQMLIGVKSSTHPLGNNAMKENNAPLKSQAPTMDRGTPFKEMTMAHKIAFVLKVVVCALSFGFIFPDVMNS